MVHSAFGCMRIASGEGLNELSTLQTKPAFHTLQIGIYHFNLPLKLGHNGTLTLALVDCHLRAKSCPSICQIRIDSAA